MRRKKHPPLRPPLPRFWRPATRPRATAEARVRGRARLVSANIGGMDDIHYIDTPLSVCNHVLTESVMMAFMRSSGVLSFLGISSGHDRTSQKYYMTVHRQTHKFERHFVCTHRMLRYAIVNIVRKVQQA